MSRKLTLDHKSGVYPDNTRVRVKETHYDDKLHRAMFIALDGSMQSMEFYHQTTDGSDIEEVLTVGDELIVIMSDDRNIVYEFVAKPTTDQKARKIIVNNEGGMFPLKTRVSVTEIHNRGMARRFIVTGRSGDRNGYTYYHTTLDGSDSADHFAVGDEMIVSFHAGGRTTYTFVKDHKESEAMATTTKKKGSDAELSLEERMEKFPDVGIKREGEKIIVPEGMDLEVAQEWLARRAREENQFVAVNEVIEGYPLDGAHAFSLALTEKFGWSGMVNSFWGPTPAMLAVETAVGKTIQVPWGEFSLPGVDGTVTTRIGAKNYRPAFQVTGNIKFKHKTKFAELMDLTRKLLVENSLYRGKAIRVSFPDTTSRAYDPSQDMPNFMDVGEVTPEKLIFSKSVMEQIETSVFAPIRRTKLALKHGIPLKRGILLHGKFGTGKTLTANATAYLAVKYGWTFIYLKNVAELANAIPFAKAYQPAVIFGEDGDRITGERDDAMNELLNVIDGVDSKSAQVMVVLTTNHVENIESVALRPGRLDAVIHVAEPDAEAAQRLVRLYAGKLLAAEENLSDVGIALDGKIPAVIREVVERSKLAAISRLDENEDEFNLEANDLLVAARGMEEHLKLLLEKEPVEPDQIRAARVYGESLGTALGATVGAVHGLIAKEKENVA